MGLVEHPVGVSRVLAGAVLADGDECFGVLLLVLVDEDLEDVGGGEELGNHDPLGGLVGADLVDGGPSGHPEGDDYLAALVLDEQLARDGEVLEAGHGTAHHLETSAVPGAGLELVEGDGAHVDAGEHRVDDADAVHAAMIRARALAVSWWSRSSTHPIGSVGAMLAGAEIRTAIAEGLMEIEPLEASCLGLARYDMRVGHEAYVSGSDGKIDVANKGLVVIDPGEFAVIVTRERVRCGPQIAGQLGLSSAYARQGLMLLSGPQIDPGFEGRLIVRVTNLAPRRVTLGYEGAFLTTQYLKLAAPVERPYQGSRQGQTGLSAKDIEATADPESPTLGGMVKSLQTLARDVSSLQASVRAMAWVVGIGLPLVVAVVGTIVGLRS